MKNLKPEYKNKIFTVILLIAIIVILIIALIFLAQQEESKPENITSTTSTSTTDNIDDDTTTTTTNAIDDTSTTTTTTTTTSIVEVDEDEIAYNAIKKYLDSFYMENYIRSYDIKDIEVLNEVECHNLSKNENKIYAQVDLTYEKINLNVEINPNEEQVQGNNFSLNIIFIINKNNNNIENLKKVC